MRYIRGSSALSRQFIFGVDAGVILSKTIVSLQRELCFRTLIFEGSPKGGILDMFGCWEANLAPDRPRGGFLVARLEHLGRLLAAS